MRSQDLLAPGSVQILEVGEVTGASRGSLHSFQVLDRADEDGHSEDLGLAGSRAKLLVGRDSVQALDNVEAAEVRLDRDLPAAGQRGSNRYRTAKQGFALLHMPTSGYRDLGHSLEVVDVGGNHDIDVFRSSYNAPRVHGKAAHDDEPGARGGESPQQLVESWFGQLAWAAPVNRISLWLSAMPSARFTLSVRCASSRSRCTRTAFAIVAPDGVVFWRSFTVRRC